jgi:SRSO17 transposase
MDAKEIARLKPRLTEFLSRFDDCFPRCDTREHLPVYVQGQLSDIERKSVEPIALKAKVKVRTLQEFLSQHRWDEDRMRQRLQEIVVAEHQGPQSIGIFDETSDAKKGTKTPGVQRQYCGAEGKPDNCIVTVHLGLADGDFHCLVDGELFLPEGWAADRSRCQEAGIPDTMAYRPKSEIALELYDRSSANGIRFAYVTFDEWYGSKPEFLRGLDSRGQRYVAEVHKRFVAWPSPGPRVTNRPYRRGGKGRGRRTPRLAAGSPKPRFLEALLARPEVRDRAWERYRVKDGEKGPLVWEVKHTLIHPKDEHGLPARPHHWIVARNVLHPEEVKHFVSNAPADTPAAELLLVAFSRWRIERCFQDQKGEVGLDHYEGRRYRGLKRHYIITMLSYLFLTRVVKELRGEKPGANGLSGSYGDDCGGAGLVAVERDPVELLRAGSGGDPVHPGPPRPRPEEPHQDDDRPATCPGHTAQGPAPMPMEHDLAL